MDIQQTINLEILKRFDEGGICFGVPPQTLLVQSSVDEARGTNAAHLHKPSQNNLLAQYLY